MSVSVAIRDEDVARVRSFNRTVTQRIGVLYDEYLGRARPLGASRVLWEVDQDGADVRELRARLDLDSGYLSRLLRLLEADGLVSVRQARDDHRVRVVRLTEAGRAERTELDRRSDDIVRTLVAPLTVRQREQLLDAMAAVERLLDIGLIEVTVENPNSEDAQYCLGAYFAELDSRFESGFDAAVSLPLTSDDLSPPSGLLLLARLRGEPIGCGAMHFLDAERVYLKRMWVAPEARGRGVGQLMLAALEHEATQRGARVVVLKTNQSLVEAISMYRASGYVEVEPFNAEPYADHWFEKRLPAAGSTMSESASNRPTEAGG